MNSFLYKEIIVLSDNPLLPEYAGWTYQGRILGQNKEEISLWYRSTVYTTTLGGKENKPVFAHKKYLSIMEAIEDVKGVEYKYDPPDEIGACI